MEEPSAIFEIVHSILENDQDGHLSVKEMCAIAGVSRSGYYAWVAAAPEKGNTGRAGPKGLRPDT